MSTDKSTRQNSTWEEFEKIFRRRWINDANLKDIQDKLKEAKEELNKKCDDLLKVRSLNETLIREVHKLKQENASKGKQENEQLREEVKMKDEEMCRLRNHNKTLLDEVKRLK